MARRRCLMILSVLSGERAVTEVIMEAGISRGMYYELETRALGAMLRALAPGAGAEETATTAEKRVVELEQRLKKVETDRRRAERLLLLTRKVMRRGPMKMATARSKRRACSTRGSKPSSASKKTPNSKPTERPGAPSIPTPDGEVAR